MTELVVGLIVAYLVISVMLIPLWLWLSPPPDSLFPAEAAVIRSDGEGFTQRVLKVEADRLWLQVTLDPHAAGPPPHVHAHFTERFRVASGRIQLDLPDGALVLTEQQERLVPAGTPHRVSNPSDEPAVVEGPLTVDYALPRRFGLFLLQGYGFFDESPRNAQLPRAILQLSFWSPLYDVWLPGPPLLVQRILFVLVRPVALLLGYRPWYLRFAPSAARQAVSPTNAEVRSRVVD